MAKDEYKIEAYDCSQPANIKMYDRAAHCKFDPAVEGVPEKVTILQHVNSQAVGGYKCQVTSHRMMYYCGLFSYSKPILSAEQEQTLVITAQSCAKMAHTRQFVTPQGRKTETLVVPGRTYIMEFSSGFQTASNSEIKCQGSDILIDGSIQHGIVTHMEYRITIETEMFAIKGTKVRAMSSSELLACNPRGPAMGCVGALHTYAWSKLADSCTYKKIREVQGLLTLDYFASSENELFYELKAGHALPIPCGGYCAFSTNVNDIMLVRSSEVSEENRIETIQAQDVSYAAEIRSLSLFLRFKLEVIEGRKEALGKSVVCALNVKEPGEAAPHRLEDDTFLFRRADVIYEYACKKVIVELIDSESCYHGAPIKQLGKYRFVNLENRMLVESAHREPCVENFPRVLRGTDGWIRFGPKVKRVPPPRSEDHARIVLSHHADEVGLYKEQEERDFEHISNLLGYKEQVIGTLVHAVCSQDDECDLNPLPGSPSYSLSKLEKETVEFVELGPWDYFLVKIVGPIWMGVSFVGICGGLITAMQHGAWIAKSGMRVCKSCKKRESEDNRRTAQLLMDLMGDSQSMPMNNRRPPPPDVRYTSRFGNKEEKVELTELPRV